MEQPNPQFTAQHRFLIGALVVWGIVFGLLAYFVPQNELHFWWDPLRFSYWNGLGYILSTSVEWPIFFLFLGLFFQKKVRSEDIVGFFVSLLIVGGVIFVFKHFLFPDMPRPWQYFPQGSLPKPFPSFKPLYQHSFPSGHTATAVVAALWGAYFTRKFFVPFWGLWAFGVGASRVLLHQHWMHDVSVGVFIGCLAFALGQWLAKRILYIWTSKSQEIK